jgi:hypothetical protein
VVAAPFAAGARLICYLGVGGPGALLYARSYQEMKSVEGSIIWAKPKEPAVLGSIGRRCFCHTFAAFITGGVVG